MGALIRRIGPVPLADLLLALLIAIPTAAFCFRESGWTQAQTRYNARDIWFDADSDRVYAIEAAFDPLDYDRTILHPLYPFLTAPIHLIRRFVTSSQTASQVFHAGLAGVWLAAFFLMLRRLGCRRPDALVFTAVAGTSAASVFWLEPVEAFVMGSLSMFPALAIAAGPRPAGPLAHFVSGVLAYGITVTNWMAALFSSFLDLPRRKFAVVTLATLAAGALFTYLHTVVLPGSTLFLHNTAGDTAWIFSPESNGGLAVMRVFFLGGMVAPEIHFVDNWMHAAWPLMTFQFGPLAAPTVWAWTGTVAWMGLLAAGFYALIRLEGRERLRTVLGLTILYQLLLHLCYGRETFLYAMHFAPLLIMSAALATQTRWRPVVLLLALVLAGANAVHNRRQFWWAKRYLDRQMIMKRVQPEIDRLYPRPKLAGDPAGPRRFPRSAPRRRPARR